MNRRALLLAAWLVLLAAGALHAHARLQIGGDLRLFLPSPRTAQERLLLDELGEGPASRLLLVELTGAAPEELARTSLALAERLRREREFQLVANGAQSADAIPDRLLPYRYLLTDRFDRAPLDAARLREALEARVRDLASPAGAMLEEWVPRDPTLEVLAIAERWQPAREPRRLDDVWFDSAGTAALLVLETRAAAFDPEAQGRAIRTLERALASVRTSPTVELTASGPGAFSVLMRERTEREASWIGTVDTVAIVALLLIAYRSLRLTLLAALPLATAGVAGLVAVSALYGEVHGITLAFGFTLIGVVQDYPVHLLSHRHPGVAPLDTARSLWRTLGTGIASTCIAYLAFLFSGVNGLAQLAVFTIAGLVAAGLATRHVLPRMLGETDRDVASARWLGTLGDALGRIPRPAWLAPALAVGAVAAIALAPTTLWDEQLSNLTPVPRPLLERDSRLRAELAAPDVRHLVVVEAPDADAALARSGEIAAVLQALVASGALVDYDAPSRYLPPTSVQRARQRALPDAAAVSSFLDAATAGLPFRPEVFAAFAADVSAARQLPPLTPASLAGTSLEARLSALLLQREDRVLALITLTGLRDVAALERVVAGVGRGVTVLDMKIAAEGLVARQRTDIVRSLLVAAMLLVAVVWIALRNARRVLRVLLPMALTTLLIVAVLQLGGVSLNLFHLISLVLAAGLGLDYALFFERAGEEELERRRTLHALLVCSAATLLVFSILALSTIPVLRSIGITVALGVAFNFLLGLLLAQSPRRSHE